MAMPQHEDPIATSSPLVLSFAEKEDEHFMKEEDAAILERGLRDSCSSGETPVLAHQHAAGAPNVPVMVLNEGGSSVEQSVIDEAGALLAQVVSLNPSSERTELARRVYRRCLSGDILTSSRHDEEGTDASPESVVDELQQLLASELSAEDQSRTMDRLMNEVTQYAEAVGELPPDESQLQEIIEDEESDSDAYSAEGVEIGEERVIEIEPPDRSDSFARKLNESCSVCRGFGRDAAIG